MSPNPIDSVSVHDGGTSAAEQNKRSISEAFADEFGQRPVDRIALGWNHSDVANLVGQHFDEVANLKHRRDGSWLSQKPSLSSLPRTVSYFDLREMEMLADNRAGLSNYYDAGTITAHSSNQMLYSQLGGGACGALLGGVLRLALPAIKGDTGGVCLGLMAVGGLIGMKVGEYLGKESISQSLANDNYLITEKAAYGDWLGGGYGENAKIVSAGLGVMGLAAQYCFGAEKAAHALLFAAAGTMLIGGPIARQVGINSAEHELETEAAIGRRMENEWKALGH